MQPCHADGMITLLECLQWQVDLIPQEERAQRLHEAKRDIAAQLKGTK